MNSYIIIFTLCLGYVQNCCGQIPQGLVIPEVTVAEWNVILKFAAKEKLPKLSDAVRERGAAIADKLRKDMSAISKREGGATPAEDVSAVRTLMISYFMFWYASEVHPPNMTKKEIEIWQVRRLDIVNVLSSYKVGYSEAVNSSWSNMMATLRALGLPTTSLP